jgi:hypothetical protein
MEHRTARDQQRQARRAREKLNEGRRGVAELLDVVEHEQELARGEDLRERLERLPAALVDLERLGDRRHEERGIVHGRQLDERRAVRIRRRGAVGRLERKPGLAAPARPGEDDQPRVARSQQRGQRLELTLPADESVGRLRQSSGSLRRAFADVERRVLLEDPSLQVAELGEPAPVRARGRDVDEAR